MTPIVYENVRVVHKRVSSGYDIGGGGTNNNNTFDGNLLQCVLRRSETTYVRVVYEETEYKYLDV